MSAHTIGSAGRSVTAGAVIFLLSLAATGRAQTQASRPSVAPRTADGQPDIQGFYTGDDSTSIEPNVDTAKGVGAYDFVWSLQRNDQKVDDVIKEYMEKMGKRTDSPDGTIPFQPWAREKKTKNLATMIDDPKGVKRIEDLDPVARCLPPGVPRSNYTYGYNGYQILQPPGYVVILSEWNHIYRVIPLDGRPHVSANIRLWMGDSRGHWEGNTLVVDVTNSNGRTWMDMAGTFHTDALHIVERYTITDTNTIRYEAAIDDPKVFTRPWKYLGSLTKADSGYEVFEYACAEGNNAVANAVIK